MKRKRVRIPETPLEAIHVFDGESARAAAVLAGAYLEEVLDRVLDSWLITDEQVKRLYRNANQKVDLAFALGIVSEEVRQDLFALQKIRNFFAHHVLDARSFAEPCVVERLDRISWAKAWRARQFDHRGVYLGCIMSAVDVLKEFLLKDRSSVEKAAEAEARRGALARPSPLKAAALREARKARRVGAHT